jgi:pimeloyl-ACP methyl ester carboxylesterase
MPASKKPPTQDVAPRLRRAYFECRYGQLHVHHAIPHGGGFDEHTTLICIHDRRGEPHNDARSMLPYLAVFGRSRSVYAPDLPGTGESDAPPPAEAGSVAAAVAALTDFLADMRIRQVDLLGVGMGASVARALGAELAAGVRRLVLLGQTPGTPAGRPSQALLELPAAPPAVSAAEQRLAEFLK